jgi:polysaccharide deacetylase 2 family uncharacterized protein YibQ
LQPSYATIENGMSGRDGGASSFRTIAVLMLLPIGGLLLVLAWSLFQPLLHPTASQKSAVTQASVLTLPSNAQPPHQAGKGPVLRHEAPQVTSSQNDATHRGDIALILDDVGFDHQPLAGAMAIDPNLSFAILPNSDYALAAAGTLHGGGFELLCHLPMEPIGYPRKSPGPNAVLTSMTDEEIARTTRANVGAIPNIRGVNNHMGSLATSDRRVMTTVLGALPKGLYFIDSRTAGTSIAGKVAREMDIPTASRSVFLDDVQNEAAVRQQLARLAEAAHSHGVAVGIGHMYPVTMRVLTEEVPHLRAEGFRFVRASQAVR